MSVSCELEEWVLLDTRDRRRPGCPPQGGSCGPGSPREYSRGSRTRPGADRSAAGAERIGGETGLMAPDVVIVAVALQEQGDVPLVARGVVRAVGRVLVADEGHHDGEPFRTGGGQPGQPGPGVPGGSVSGVEIVHGGANDRDEQAAVRREIVLVDVREVAVQQHDDRMHVRLDGRRWCDG